MSSGIFLKTYKCISIIIFNVISDLPFFFLPVCHSLTEFFTILIFLVCSINILLQVGSGIAQGCNQVFTFRDGIFTVLIKNSCEMSFKLTLGYANIPLPFRKLYF